MVCDSHWLPVTKLRKYINYSQSGDWQANTDNIPLPSILFITPNEKRKKHILKYGHAKLKKAFEEITVFITTRDQINFSDHKVSTWDLVG